jgi:hypothetical protein
LRPADAAGKQAANGDIELAGDSCKVLIVKSEKLKVKSEK